MAATKYDSGACSPGTHSLVQKYSIIQTLDGRTTIEEISAGVASEPNTVLKEGPLRDSS